MAQQCHLEKSRQIIVEDKKDARQRISIYCYFHSFQRVHYSRLIRYIFPFDTPFRAMKLTFEKIQLLKKSRVTQNAISTTTSQRCPNENINVYYKNRLGRFRQFCLRSKPHHNRISLPAFERSCRLLDDRSLSLGFDDLSLLSNSRRRCDCLFSLFRLLGGNFLWSGRLSGKSYITCCSQLCHNLRLCKRQLLESGGSGLKIQILYVNASYTAIIQASFVRDLRKFLPSLSTIHGFGIGLPFSVDYTSHTINQNFKSSVKITKINILLKAVALVL